MNIPEASLTPAPGVDDAVVGAATKVTSGNTVRGNLLVLAGGQATTWTMTLLWTLVVPRVLGPSGLGLITAVWAVAGIMSILLGLGTTNYVARQLVADPAAAGRLVGSALVLRVVMVPVFVACAVIFAHFAHYGHDARLVLWLATGATLFTLLDEPLLVAFQARERMQYMAFSDVINKSAQGLVGIIIVLVGFGAVGLTASWLVVSILVLILGVRWIKPLVKIDLRTNIRQIAELVRASGAYFASGVFFLVYLWIDSVMLSLMTRNEVVGWYAVPTKLLGTFVFLPVIISNAWLPRLVRTFETSPDDLGETARPPIELALVLSLPLCAACALAARPLIPLLYGQAYEQSVPVMVILGFTLIPMYANIVFSSLLVAMRRQVRLTMLMAGAAVVNPALNFFLIRFTERHYHNGAIGAAICMLLTELLIVSAEIILVGRRFLSKSSILRVTRTALASGGMWAVGYLARPLGWYVSLPLAGLAFVLLAWILRIAGPVEKEMLQTAIAKARARLRGSRQGAIAQ
jgi:O-antigen/teichoic acid export membrane protein